MMAIKTTFITDVQPLRISGKNTNYTWILERIWIMGTNYTQTTYKNRIPDTYKYADRYTSFLNRRLNDNDINELLNNKNGDKMYMKIYDKAENSHGKLNTDDVRFFEIQDGELKERKLKNETSGNYSGNKYSVDTLLEQLKDEYDNLERDESKSQPDRSKIFDITNNDRHNNKFTQNNDHLFVDKNIAKLKNTLGKSEIDPSFLVENYGDNSMELINKDKLTRRQNLLPSRKAPRKRSGRAKARSAALLESQQKQKRKAILKFLEANYLSTNYFYDEMKRILRDRVIKDDLRLMVQSLEKDENKKLKVAMLKYYERQIKKRAKRLYDANFWKHKMNNLVIHEVSDAFNNGD